MPCKKQTLADYLHRQEVLRNANRYQGLSENERERIEYFDAKKKKVGVLLNDILYQAKKSVQNEENYSKLQKMIKSAIDEIKTEFDNTNKFTQEKPKGEIPQLDTQPDLSRISLHQNLLTKQPDSKVLKESNKMIQTPVKADSDYGKIVQGKQSNRAKENAKVMNPRSRPSIPQGK